MSLKQDFPARAHFRLFSPPAEEKTRPSNAGYPFSPRVDSNHRRPRSAQLYATSFEIQRKWPWFFLVFFLNVSLGFNSINCAEPEHHIFSAFARFRRENVNSIAAPMVKMSNVSFVARAPLLLVRRSHDDNRHVRFYSGRPKILFVCDILNFVFSKLYPLCYHE